MLTVRTAAHIPTSRHLRNFHLCPASTATHAARTGAFRPLREWLRLFNAESRRQWLHQQWCLHLRLVHSRQGRI